MGQQQNFKFICQSIEPLLIKAETSPREDHLAYKSCYTQWNELLNLEEQSTIFTQFHDNLVNMYNLYRKYKKS